MAGDDGWWEASLDATRRRLEDTPDPAATGPADDAATLRAAYLDLLKLVLCDLGGTRTLSAVPQPDGGVVTRELAGWWRRIRVAGMDWPATGLSMVGLPRLTDLQACVEQVVADRIPGDVIEAGTWRGGASILARATLDALGDDREVWVADSFQGFRPTREPVGHADMSPYDFLSVPEQEVRDNFARFGLDRGVRFLRGYFEDTLPTLAGHRWSLVRLDGDTYEATMHGLRCLYPGLSAGGWLVLDDYGSWPGCKLAVDEFRAEYGIADPLVEIDHTGARWRRSDGPTGPAAPVPPAPATEAPPYDPCAAPPLRTEREQELEARLLTARPGTLRRALDRLRRGAR